MNTMKYNSKITLYNSYFDSNDRLNLKSILNIFQDIASVHGEILGVGYEAMLEKNLYWVLSRVKFDILKMPKINQNVVVETWPHPKGRIDFDRDMRILSENGEVLVVGTSKWCVIDTVTRTLQRTDNVDYVGEYCNEVNYEGRFNKIMLPENNLEKKFNYFVRFSDLDHNQHMNNTNYANLVLNAVDNKKIKHFEINFISECRLDEEIDLYAIKNNGEYVIGKVKEEEAFRAFVK